MTTKDKTGLEIEEHGTTLIVRTERLPGIGAPRVHHRGTLAASVSAAVFQTEQAKGGAPAILDWLG